MSKSAERIARMPDVASQAQSQVAGRLDWVGMNRMEMPIRIEDDHGRVSETVARVSAFVDLDDPEAKGIHMSRLYLHLDQTLAEHSVTPFVLRRLLGEFLESHEGLSGKALVRLDFDYLVRRPALVSDNSGWKQYPFSLIASLEDGEFCLEMAFQVLYSSTCPCSAALARQLIQEQFSEDFADRESVQRDEIMAWLGSEKGIMATPHSQRSAADLRVQLAPGFERFPFIELIDRVEDAVQTPVQAAVKREDEQAFARLNGANLMFCEDSGRRIRSALAEDERITDFWARCQHFESLHPHNAVAIVTKGIEGGYKPIDGHPTGWRT